MREAEWYLDAVWSGHWPDNARTILKWCWKSTTEIELVTLCRSSYRCRVWLRRGNIGQNAFELLYLKGESCKVAVCPKKGKWDEWGAGSM